jgi:hypothetical protein
MEVNGQFHSPEAFPQWRATVLKEQDARSIPEPVWAFWSKENCLASVLGRPARSQILTTLVRLLDKVRNAYKSSIYCPIDFEINYKF